MVPKWHIEGNGMGMGREFFCLDNYGAFCRIIYRPHCFCRNCTLIITQNVTSVLFSCKLITVVCATTDSSLSAHH